MDVLIIGRGSRESALGRAFLRANRQVYVAPGNPGMRLVGLTPVAIDEMAFDQLVDFARAHDLFTFVGPEAPLAAGIVDAFTAAGLPVFGPHKRLAQLESSKTFAKVFMHRHEIPTATATVVHNLADARAALAKFGVPLVIKADGLAAGKGVTVALDLPTAEHAITSLYAAEKRATVVLEDYLDGEEVSVMALFNGSDRVILPLSQDHKRRFDGDIGPNTGGMGAIAPAPQFGPEVTAQAEVIVDQTLAGMVADGIAGCGVLYVGLMITKKGPMVLEYNLRFGDPETQVLLPQIQNDLLAVLQGLAEHHVETLQLDGRTYVGVVLAHPGYPTDTKPALPVVTPLDASDWEPAGMVEQDGELFTAGGRIATVVAGGVDLRQAQQAVYRRVTALAGELAYRKDIGWHAYKI